MNEYITLFGERRSGTKWMDLLLRRFFSECEFGYKYGGKHWWDRSPAWLHENEGLKESDTHSIILVREPVAWALSMYRAPLAINHMFCVTPKMNPFSMIREFPIGEICLDADIVSLDSKGRLLDGPYKGLMDLRYQKFAKMKHGTNSRCVVIRYEDLIEDYRAVMEQISRTLGIGITYSGDPKPDPDVPSEHPSKMLVPHSEVSIVYGEKELEKVYEAINWEIEKDLGYGD